MAGCQLEVLVDSSNVEIKKMHFFITTVAVSNLVYAETSENEKLSNFIVSTVHVLEAYSATPKYFVLDKLKTAITKHIKDELVITSAYKDLKNSMM